MKTRREFLFLKILGLGAATAATVAAVGMPELDAVREWARQDAEAAAELAAGEDFALELGILAPGGAKDRHLLPPPGPRWREYGRPIVARVRETPTGHPTPARLVRAVYRMPPEALARASGAPEAHDVLPYIERDFGASFVEIERPQLAGGDILLTVEWPMPW